MKVIIIKACKDGQVNDVIEVSNGYGTNFLIRQGFALPYNPRTAATLAKRIALLKKQEEDKTAQLLKIKDAIEQTTLTFIVKSNKGVFHNSISQKQIASELKARSIVVNPHSIEKLKTTALGMQSVKINLSKTIIATLQMEVTNGS